MSLLTQYDSHEPRDDFFQWNATNIDILPVIQESIDIPVVFADGDGIAGWNHQPKVGEHYGKLWVMYNSAPYDEEQAGCSPRVASSSDGGNTWVNHGRLVEPLSDPTVRVDEREWGRVVINAEFLSIEDNLYALLVVNDRKKTLTTNIALRRPLGHLVVKIDSNGDFSTPVYAHLANKEKETPGPFEEGYPDFEYDPVIGEKVLNKIKSRNFLPGTLIGWPEITNTFGYPNGNVAAESTSVMPNGYRDYRIHWKHNNFTSGLYRRNNDRGFFYTSQIIESSNGSPTSFLVLDNDTIAIAGGTTAPNRQECFLAIAKKDPLSKKFVINQENLYGLTANSKDSPRYPGTGKSGAEQHPFLSISSNNELIIAYSVSKEDIYFKKVALESIL